jgi:hypothetical protein
MATPDAPADHHGNSSGVGEGEDPELLGQLLKLPAELLVAIAAHLPEDDELAASLACRKLREAVAGTERRRVAGARLRTRIGSAFGSMSKLEWAASCGMPLCAKLLSRAARLGQLEPLRWLRAQGIAWEPCEGDGEDPCAKAAKGTGTWPCSSGLARMAAHGMSGRPRMQLRVGTCPRGSGLPLG